MLPLAQVCRPVSLSLLKNDANSHQLGKNTHAKTVTVANKFTLKVRVHSLAYFIFRQKNPLRSFRRCVIHFLLRETRFPPGAGFPTCDLVVTKKYANSHKLKKISRLDRDDHQTILH